MEMVAEKSVDHTQALQAVSMDLAIIVMAKITLGIKLVANPLLKNLGLGKAAVRLALPDLHAVADDLEHTARGGFKAHFAQVVGEG